MAKISINVAELKQALALSKIDGSNQYQLALFIANFVFAKVYDRMGVDYVQHCIRVSSNPRLKNNILAQCIALLHDVVEDSTLTIEDFSDLDVDYEVTLGVTYLTHTSDLTYDQYVNRMIANYIKYLPIQDKTIVLKIEFAAVEAALLVKLSDMEDNSRLDRLVLCEADDKSVKRITKYVINYKKILKAMNGDCTEDDKALQEFED